MKGAIGVNLIAFFVVFLIWLSVTRLLNGNWQRPDELIQSTDYEGMNIITSNKK